MTDETVWAGGHQFVVGVNCDTTQMESGQDATGRTAGVKIWWVGPAIGGGACSFGASLLSDGATGG